MTSAIIVAAGKGTRFGPDRDKLFLEVSGRPVIAHTWDRFDKCDGIHELVVVVREGLQESFRELAAAYKFQKPYKLVPGGKERQDSVANGLAAVNPGTEIVAIQDGARPCTSHTVIQATLIAAAETGAAVAAQPVVDTIKSSDDGRNIAGHLDRSKLWAVQTPQAFRLEVIRRALSEVQKRRILVTDDTAACELIGQPVRLVSSTEPNPKVTVPADLMFVEMLLNRGGSTGV